MYRKPWIVGITTLLLLGGCKPHQRPPAQAQQTSGGANWVSSGRAPALCDQNLLDQTTPMVRQSLFSGSKGICYHGYAMLTSEKTRTGIWSAERLDAARIREARDMHRVNDFHPDPNLPPYDEAQVHDYTHSGYDRGHIAPSGDMPDAQSQEESFSLANMAPQVPMFNRGLWADIEGTVRDLAINGGPVYVVTGVAFTQPKLSIIGGRVYVPNFYFKAVWAPTLHIQGAYLANNDTSGDWSPVSFARLAQETGVDPFPSLPDRIQNATPNIPAPSEHRGHWDDHE